MPYDYFDTHDYFKDNPVNEPKFICKYCSQDFYEWSELDSHIENYHKDLL
jgi:hypothetical protein